MLEPGVTLGGRYVLVDPIGRGGMGEVWRADDAVLGRRVAVKVLLPNLAGEPGFAARFRTEARAMAALSHPGIVEIYDFGQADGVAYLVMQLVQSESLLSVIERDGPLPPGRALRLVAQAADAIHAAHLQGIVHRDVKPANLLLRPDGRLALTDFGIARIVAGDRLTAPDEIFGSASYLAPEQVLGTAITPATDVYALGVVAYELLAGRRPFEAETPVAVALQHVHDVPPALPPGVPEPVRALVLRALAKDAAERWHSAEDLARAASDLAGDLARRPVERPRGRARRAVLVGAVAAILALTGAYALSSGLYPGATGGAPQGAGQSPGTTISAAPVPSKGLTRSGAAGPGPTVTGRAASALPATPTRTAPATPTTTPAATTRTLPDMYGWRESEMTSELRRLDLVARVTYRSTLDKCYVIDQSPAGGTVVQAGSTVDVVIATATGICKIV